MLLATGGPHCNAGFAWDSNDHDEDHLTETPQSVHYVVGTLGRVTQMLPLTAVANIGPPSPYNRDMLDRSVAIALDNDGDGDDGYGSLQIEALATLIDQVDACLGISEQRNIENDAWWEFLQVNATRAWKRNLGDGSFVRSYIDVDPRILCCRGNVESPPVDAGVWDCPAGFTRTDWRRAAGPGWNFPWADLHARLEEKRGARGARLNRCGAGAVQAGPPRSVSETANGWRAYSVDVTVTGFGCGSDSRGRGLVQATLLHHARDPFGTPRTYPATLEMPWQKVKEKTITPLRYEFLGGAGPTSTDEVVEIRVVETSPKGGL